MEVYVKSVHNLKTDSICKGPYKIVDISADKNRLKVENNTEVFWANIKNVRVTNREGVECRNDTTRI